MACQATLRYSLTRPPQRVARTIRSCVVGDEPLELVLVPDGGAVEALASKGADQAFGEGVGHGCADRGLENLKALGAEDLVEVVDELAGAVSQ